MHFLTKFPSSFPYLHMLHIAKPPYLSLNFSCINTQCRCCKEYPLQACAFHALRVLHRHKIGKFITPIWLWLCTCTMLFKMNFLLNIRLRVEGFIMLYYYGTNRILRNRKEYIPSESIGELLKRKYKRHNCIFMGNDKVYYGALNLIVHVSYVPCKWKKWDYFIISFIFTCFLRLTRKNMCWMVVREILLMIFY